MKPTTITITLAALTALTTLLILKTNQPNQTTTKPNPPPKPTNQTKPPPSPDHQFNAQLRQNIENHRLAEQAQYQEDLKIAQILERQNKEEQERKRQQAKYEAAQKAYWKTREKWIANFPFQPTHHPTITYDPNIYNIHPPPNHKPKRTTQYWEMLELIQNHSFLKRFYQNPDRYSPEFEQMHHILIEAGLQPDPILWGWTFSHLTDYHQALANDNTTEKDSTLESLLARFTYYKELAGKITLILPEDQALNLRQRLITEIPPDRLLTIHLFDQFLYDDTYIQKLKPGDPLLIK